nr:FtsW/RodA/SpoVE family cell cycle protein [Buchnera aphidicola]
MFFYKFLCNKSHNKKKYLNKKKSTKKYSPILYDRMLLWLTLSLSVIGFVMITSASLPLGESLYHDPFFFEKREICYFFITFIISFFF